MTQHEIYFSDNFFSAGLTDIYNEQQERIGQLDLKSAFSYSVDVLDQSGRVMVKGRFPFFSRKWMVTNDQDQELGVLKQRFAFFSKKYEYQTNQRGAYQIESEAFSKEYQILDEQGKVIAIFEKISGFFQSSAYKLTNHSEHLSYAELVAVVMGVNMINNHNNAAASNSGGS